MAWHTGVFLNGAAGSLIAVLDAKLLLNDCWSIYDTVGANDKVYECKDEAEYCLFYLRVKDNQADYAQLELWEGWDAIGHVGVGASRISFSGVYYWRFRRPAGAWMLSVRDHCFIYIDYNFSCYFVGQPERFDTTKNIVFIIATTTGSTLFNNLAYFSTATAGGCGFLFDENGNQPDGGMSFGAAYTSYRVSKSIDGRRRYEPYMIYGKNTTLNVGYILGVINVGNETEGLANGDIVQIDGEDWLCCGGGYSTKHISLVRKA